MTYYSNLIRERAVDHSPGACALERRGEEERSLCAQNKKILPFFTGGWMDWFHTVERENTLFNFIVGGSLLRGATGFHETTLSATIFTLFLFSIRAPVRGVTHTLFFKMRWVGWNAGGGRDRYSGSLGSFQRGIGRWDSF